VFDIEIEGADRAGAEANPQGKAIEGAVIKASGIR
jgi:hypothetical protein